MDNFKLVNDTLGHDKGDAVLRRLSDILRSNTREYDLIGRLGGDEFAMWLDDTDAKSRSSAARSCWKRPGRSRT